MYWMQLFTNFEVAPGYNFMKYHRYNSGVLVFTSGWLSRSRWIKNSPDILLSFLSKNVCTCQLPKWFICLYGQLILRRTTLCTINIQRTVDPVVNKLFENGKRFYYGQIFTYQSVPSYAIVELESQKWFTISGIFIT